MMEGGLSDDSRIGSRSNIGYWPHVTKIATPIPPPSPSPPPAAADVGLNQIKLEKLNSAQFNHYFYDFALIAKSSISSRTERIELMDETTEI